MPRRVNTFARHCIIFVNYIINWTGEVMSHMQPTQISENVCSTLNSNQLIVTLEQKCKRQVEGGKSKELVYRPWRNFEIMFSNICFSQGLLAGQ
jgi:hypothetical protein